MFVWVLTKKEVCNADLDTQLASARLVEGSWAVSPWEGGADRRKGGAQVLRDAIEDHLKFSSIANPSVIYEREETIEDGACNGKKVTEDGRGTVQSREKGNAKDQDRKKAVGRNGKLGDLVLSSSDESVRAHLQRHQHIRTHS